jgi:aminoglycoside phosphotransferase (APT) family kinase protein
MTPLSPSSPALVDIEAPPALRDYLRQSGRVAASEEPTIRVLAGGVSNKTVWVQRASGEAWVLKQALPKLRVAVDWFSSPARIQRETLGLRWLTKLAPAETIPGFVFEDPAQYILAMQAVPEPHANWKQVLLSGDIRVDHVRQFGRLLAEIHSRSYAQRGELAPLFDDRSFFESLRVEPYYSYSAEQVPAAAPFIAALTEETRATRLTLVHGDYSPKNILVYRERLILLDHEVIHFGDPAFDIGFSMTHLLSKAHHLPNQRAVLADAAREYWRTYWSGVNTTPWGDDAFEARAVRHTVACLLARVSGRSQLEYFSGAEKSLQRSVVLGLMPHPPRQIPDLIERFISGLRAS